MIRVVMLDLGDTLTDGTQPLPFVLDCLDALSRFETSDGKLLQYCLVSDYHLASPFTEGAVAERFSEFLEVIERLGLRSSFEPVNQRITLSSHVNAFKPDPRVFTKALDRMGSDAGFEDCLFITENRMHISACAEMGMSTIPFGYGAAQEGGFDSWPEGLILISKAVDQISKRNFKIALSVFVRARYDLDNLQIIDPITEHGVAATAQAWTPLESTELGALDGVCVQMQVSLTVTEIEAGFHKVVITVPPTQENIDEARQFIRSLELHQQIEGPRPSVIGSASHYIETESSGQRKLKRRGFQ
jgi:FMN phosphatase YigB (HAD superfamily)